MKTKLLIFTIILFGIAVLYGCEKAPIHINHEVDDGVLHLGDIAYDEEKNPDNFTIYIKENDGYESYLVLSNHYNGNAVLLRKYLLEENQIFDEDTGYYPDSYIDNYLSNEFILEIDKATRDLIIESEIEAVTQDSISIAGTGTINISRKIFLLGIEDIYEEGFSFSPQYNGRIDYLDSADRLIALKGEKQGSWWLRTSYTTGYNLAWAIAFDGRIGSGGTYYINCVRPAFCLSNGLEVVESTRIVDGKKIYIIDIE